MFRLFLKRVNELRRRLKRDTRFLVTVERFLDWDCKRIQVLTVPVLRRKKKEKPNNVLFVHWLDLQNAFSFDFLLRKCLNFLNFVDIALFYFNSVAIFLKQYGKFVDIRVKNEFWCILKLVYKKSTHLADHFCHSM